MGGIASVTDLYSSLQGQRVRVSETVTEGERERRPVRHGEIMPVRFGNSVMYVSQSKKKHLKFWLLIILGSGGI